MRIPIARYLCREKEKRGIKHRTFSLLPDILIPYYAVTIDTMLLILQLLFANNNYVDKTLEKIDSISPGDILLSDKMLYNIRNLFDQTRLKLLMFIKINQEKDWAPPDIETYNQAEILNFIMNFKPQKMSDIENGSSSYQLSVFYYSQNGTYMKNSHFLFGTAFQFRK